MKKVVKFVKPSAPVHPFSCLQLRKRTDYFLIILTILDNYSYNIAPWTFNKRSGSVFSFGIEPCFLILARAIIGTKPLISQTLVQSIFDHFVLQTVKHRIPATVYPYCTLFTRMPDIDGNGLSMQTIDEEDMYHDSPVPSCVLYRAPHVCRIESRNHGSPNGTMVEDVLVLNKFQRICQMVDMNFDALHLDDLTPPQLPFYTWVYLELVQKTDSLDQSKFDASKARYKKTCIYIDPKKNKITRFISTATFARARDRNQIDLADPDANKMRSQKKVFRNITDTVMPLKKGILPLCSDLQSCWQARPR